MGLPGQEAGAAWGSDGKVPPHHMGLVAVALTPHHCWAKQTHQGLSPNFDSPRRVPKQDSQVLLLQSKEGWLQRQGSPSL